MVHVGSRHVRRNLPFKGMKQQHGVTMKPEEFASNFMKAAASLGCQLTPEGNIFCDGGKNISRSKAATIFRRYGTNCVECAKAEFKNDPKAFVLFKNIATKTLG